jgi:carboxylesterase type B
VRPVACVTLSAAQLLDVQARVTTRSAGVAYGPVADGTDVPSDAEAVIAGGSAAGIPLLVGMNLEEYKFFRRMDGAVETLTDETLLARLADPRTTAEARDKAMCHGSRSWTSRIWDGDFQTVSCFAGILASLSAHFVSGYGRSVSGWAAGLEWSGQGVRRSPAGG